MSTTTIYTTTADGYLKSENATYSTARAGGTITKLDNYQDIWVDQAPGYLLYCAFLAFDTSGIPDDDEISAATLSLYPHESDAYAGSPGTLEVYAYDFGSSLETGDWVAGADVSALTLVASTTTSGWTTGARRALASQEAFKAAINKIGSTRLFICLSGFRTGDAPASESWFGFHSAEKGAGYAPMLVVEHAAPLMSTTTTVYAGTNDGYITSANATYATARSGGTLSVTNAEVDLWIDQYNGSPYELYCSYLAFDTSGVGTDVISAVRMYGYPENTYGPVFGSPGALEVYQYTWTSPLTTADWVPGATVAGWTKIASIAAGSFTAGAYRQFTSESGFPAAINKTGTTYLYLCTADFRTGSAPATEDGYGLCSADDSGGIYAVKLEIDHAPAATGLWLPSLMGPKHYPEFGGLRYG